MSHQCSRVKVALLLLSNSEFSVSSSASASTRETKLADQLRACAVGSSAQAIDTSSTAPAILDANPNIPRHPRSAVVPSIELRVLRHFVRKHRHLGIGQHGLQLFA